MVKIMENPIKIHDLGVPLFLDDPNTERQWMIGVSNHLRNTKYFGFHDHSQKVIGSLGMYRLREKK